MGLLKEFTTGLQVKAAGVNDLPFPNLATLWHALRPRMDTKKVGDGLSNSAAYSVVTSMGRAFAEPTIREYQRSDGQEEEVEQSPTADLLAEPNPYMESDLLYQYAVASIAATGSGYIHKVKNAFGQTIQLWPLYPAFVKPHTPQSGSEFLDYWEYTVPGRNMVPIAPDDMIQLRWQINRHDHRLGWSPLQQVLIEILEDDEAAIFSTALLMNMGVPGVIMTPKDPNDPGPQGKALDKMKADYQSKFGGTKRGEPLVVGGGSMNISVVSFSPEQMDLTALRRLPEERISGVMGWPAILAGLGAGLDRGTYSNAETLREFATEQTLVPLWRLTAKQLTRQLLRDIQPDKTHTLGFDLTEVRALSQDEDDMVTRLNTAIQGGWALVSEGRRAIGLPVEDRHDVFLRNVSTYAVPVDADAAEDEEGDPDE